MTAQRAIYLKDIYDGSTDVEMWLYAYRSYFRNLEFVNTVNLCLSIISLFCQLIILAFLIWLIARCWR